MLIESYLAWIAYINSSEYADPILELWNLWILIGA